MTKIANAALLCAIGSHIVGWSPPYMRCFVEPILRLAGPLFKLAGSVEQGAHRSGAAAQFGSDENRMLFASAASGVSGPLEMQNDAHLEERRMQDAVWQVLLKLTGSRARGCSLA